MMTSNRRPKYSDRGIDPESPKVLSIVSASRSAYDRAYTEATQQGLDHAIAVDLAEAARCLVLSRCGLLPKQVAADILKGREEGAQE